MASDQSQIKALWRKILQGRGHRMTEGREVVAGVLARAAMGEHLSAEDIFLKAHGENPSIGLTSVYRTLDLLVHLGLIHKFDFGDGRARYEMAEGSRVGKHHHHLVCTGCSTIVDYDDFIDEELKLLKKTEEGLSLKFGFKITGHIVQFHGLCSQCSASEREHA
ncbi:MAG TPA: Fur family transcriptional regulator [Desulfomonilaceae bacterium]|nr:Fur family transcriptional regulator [Desulfomonilaceae bacterium]